jgi:BASS family bile acid:Na+ symporter
MFRRSKIGIMLVFKIIKNRNFIFILALVLGLSIGNHLTWTRHLTLPVITIMMIVTMTEISLKSLRQMHRIFKPVLLALLLNYIIFASVMLTLAWIIIPDKILWIGFILIALAPPGAGIAPFTRILGGDLKFSLVGVIGGYIAALVIIPVSGLLLVGRSFIQPFKFIILFSELIIAPLIISQVFIKTKIDKYVLKLRGPVVNWGFFIVILAVISLNQGLIFRDPVIMWKISLICFISIIGLGFFYDLLTRKLKTIMQHGKSIMLFGTIKHGSFAAATALSLYGARASLPSAMTSIFTVLFIVYLSVRADKS